MRPKLLIDVDGVLNPTRVTPGFREHKVTPGQHEASVWLNPVHAEWLDYLADKHDADLVWATEWGWQATQWIAPALGLPSMPVVGITRPTEDFMYDGVSESFLCDVWKARCVAEWMPKGMPFVWFDDGAHIGEELDCLEFEGRLSSPYEFVWVDDTYGLTRKHIDQADAWLTKLGRRSR